MWLRMLSLLALSSVLTSSFPAAVLGQGRPVELGIDAGLSVTLTEGVDATITQVAIPASRFRVGFFVSDIVEIEPSLAFALLSVNGETATAVGFQLGLAFHSTAKRDRPRMFFQVGGGLDYVNVEDFDDVQFGVGAGVGGKIPAGDRFAVRIEANYLRGFESDNRFAANIIQALVGFSFFTR